MQLYEKRGATLLMRGDLQFTKAMHLKSDLLLHPVIQKGLFFFYAQWKDTAIMCQTERIPITPQQLTLGCMKEL